MRDVQASSRTGVESGAESAVGVHGEIVVVAVQATQVHAVTRAHFDRAEPHINLTQEELDDGRKPDPRFIEAGIRVTDRLVNLYQLTKPQHQMSEPDAVSRQDQREMVRSRLLELEQKVQNRVS